MGTFVALLRGINVGGHHKVPMAPLRRACEAAGLENVRTYVQSGNLVFDGSGEPTKLEVLLEGLVLDAFEVDVPVLVRSAGAWREIAASNPFPRAGRERPALLHLALAKVEPAAGAVDALRGRAASGERIERVGDAFWIDYPSGAGRSKLTPAVLDRAAGSSVTARNFNTVQRLVELVG